MTRRPGRKRRQNVERVASGRIVREDARKSPWEARGRVFDLRPQQVPDLPESTVLGALCATGEISRRQWQAGADYFDIHADYSRMMGSPQVALGDLQSAGGQDGSDGTDPAYQAAFRRARERWKLCDDALNMAYNEDRWAKTVTIAVVLGNLPLPSYTPSLRVGLNALARVLGD